MTVHYPDDAAIERLGLALLDRSLPKAEWTHAAHFAAALWLLKSHGLAAAAARMPAIIRAYNAATGTPNTDDSGYHETITLASLRAADALMAAREGEPLHAVLDVLMESPLGRSDWLLAYWSKARLFSRDARRSWIEPDLAAFQP